LKEEQAAGERLARTPQVLQTPGGGTTSQTQSFDGPVKFYHLSNTLRAASRQDENDRNVLFAAADLSSAAAIIPLACQMANWKRNYVHFAIMGNTDTSLDTIKQINGAADDTCHVYWHDARPDYPTISSHARLETSVAGALGHIGSYLKPVVVITTDLDNEPPFFELGLARKVKERRLSHIQVPRDDPSRIEYLARLDASALSMWHTASFDVMIQAPLHGSGSLIRLLKSLSLADYTGFSPPRLIIELPYKVDRSTNDFLSSFLWPPFPFHTTGQNEHLVLRRRITEQRANPAEASLRFIESFYPTSPAGPHVLLLSSQTELSPAYFHYLKAHVLEYKHSGHAFGTSQDLFGISLEAPSSYLNGSRFDLPDLDTVQPSVAIPDPRIGPFRWQAPNSNAALYFADKWIEAHSFLTKRHSASLSSSGGKYLQSQEKLVSMESPAWVEYFLEFMRNRGWSLHYPALPFEGSQDSLAIVHNDLAQTPEEFNVTPKQPLWEDTSPRADEVLTVRDDYLSTHNPSSSPVYTLNAESPLLADLGPLLPPPPPPREPHDDDEDDLAPSYLSDPMGAQPLPYLNALPLLDNMGTVLERDELLKRAEAVRIEYRQKAGGCSASRAESKEQEMYPFQAEDLFCFDERRAAETSSHDGRASQPELPNGEDLPPQSEEAPQPEEPPRTAPDEKPDGPFIHGGDGVAVTINRVQNAEKYKETAKAGLKAKMEKAQQSRPKAPPQPPRPAAIPRPASPPRAPNS